MGKEGEGAVGYKNSDAGPDERVRKLLLENSQEEALPGEAPPPVKKKTPGDGKDKPSKALPSDNQATDGPGKNTKTENEKNDPLMPEIVVGYVEPMAGDNEITSNEDLATELQARQKRLKESNKQLTGLDLSQSAVTSGVTDDGADYNFIELLDQAPNLKVLNLADLEEHVAGGIPILAKNNKQLEELNLKHTQLRDEDFSALQQLPKLRKLDLSDISLFDGDLKKMVGAKGLPELKELKLDNNAFTAEGLQQLAAMPKLEYLSLAGNARLDLQAIGSLKQLKGLKYLNLEGTMPEAQPAAQEVVLADLQKSLPSCLIIRSDGKVLGK